MGRKYHQHDGAVVPSCLASVCVHVRYLVLEFLKLFLRCYSGMLSLHSRQLILCFNHWKEDKPLQLHLELMPHHKHAGSECRKPNNVSGRRVIQQGNVLWRQSKSWTDLPEKDL